MSDQFDGAVDARFNDQRYGRVSTATSPPTVHYVNEAGVPENVIDELRNHRDIANAIEQWSQSLRNGEVESSVDIFARAKWQGKKHPFAVMSQCAWAVENDDILSTLVEVIEGLTFKKMRFELNDEKQQDFWAQWGKKVNLDAVMRRMFREEFKTSQVYVGMWWEKKVFKVRDNGTREKLEALKQEHEDQQQEKLKQQAQIQGLPEPKFPEREGGGRGNRKSKKTFPVEVPTAFTIFDPTKILPVGQLMFGRERFAYIANDAEHQGIDAALNGDVRDRSVLQLIEGPYTPTPADLEVCGALGVDGKKLWLMREDAIFRHTLTKADYERFASVRLKSMLPILDMKAQLRASDRATLLGNANFIVVITKGTDKLPAKAAEIENLKEQARVIARLPVLVGDHRLNVQIVAPPLENTLIESRWQVLDSRLVFKALQTFQPVVQGGNSGGNVAKEMGTVVAAGLENRRHMLLRTIEREVFDRILDKNEGTLDEDPDLAFAPKRITLDFNADIMNSILKLRDRGDVSRETTLDEFDYDQDVEVIRRAREKVEYDEVFNSGTPYGSPNMNPFAANDPNNPNSQQPPAPGQPPAPAPAKAPAKKAAPKSSPEGGRPPGAKEDAPRAPKGSVKA